MDEKSTKMDEKSTMVDEKRTIMDDKSTILDEKTPYLYGKLWSTVVCKTAKPLCIFVAYMYK